jgi:hypothetical protein
VGDVVELAVAAPLEDCVELAVSVALGVAEILGVNVRLAVCVGDCDGEPDCEGENVDVPVP